VRRLFAGLEVPAEVREALAAAVAPLRQARDDLRWYPPDQWHLTVAFLGEVATPVGDVVAALDPAAAAAPGRIDLSLASSGRFGRRVLWVGVADVPAGAVATLGDQAQQALQQAGLPVDPKPVRPHLTLARSRGTSRPVDRRLVESVPPPASAWSVSQLVVFQSVQRGHREPNRYDPLARLPLGPGRGV
jgi:2'-5' RNA ligase